MGLLTKEPSTAQSGRKFFAKTPEIGPSVAAGRARTEVMATAIERRIEYIIVLGGVTIAEISNYVFIQKETKVD